MQEIARDRSLFSSASQSSLTSPNPKRGTSSSTSILYEHYGCLLVVSGGSGGGASPLSDGLAGTLGPLIIVGSLIYTCLVEPQRTWMWAQLGVGWRVRVPQVRAFGIRC